MISTVLSLFLGKMQNGVKTKTLSIHEALRKYWEKILQTKLQCGTSEFYWLEKKFTAILPPLYDR
jgi:hypothetical protein